MLCYPGSDNLEDAETMSAATTQSETAPSDEALIAEITPQMLARLTFVSRQLALWMCLAMIAMGLFWAFGQNLLLQGTIARPILGIAFPIGGLTVLARGYSGQPLLVRAELRYRRQHGKWRWER